MSFKVRAEKPSEVVRVFQILFSAAPVCVGFSPNWGSASFNDKCQLTFMGAESNVAKIFFLLNVRNVPKS